MARRANWWHTLCIEIANMMLALLAKAWQSVRDFLSDQRNICIWSGVAHRHVIHVFCVLNGIAEGHQGGHDTHLRSSLYTW